jgi:hypothetical protein
LFFKALINSRFRDLLLPIGDSVDSILVLSPRSEFEDFKVIRKIGLALALMTVTGVASASSGNSETCFQFVPWLKPFCFPTTPFSPPSGPSRTEAPEIDPASAMAGFTMLAGGIAVLRGRRRIKAK